MEHSDEDRISIGLETLTVCAFSGGYLKRRMNITFLRGIAFEIQLRCIEQLRLSQQCKGRFTCNQ